MELFTAGIAFGADPFRLSSVPCALVGVQSVDQLALTRREAKLIFPNACCFQMLRSTDAGTSVKV
jgi:hypothetical protein